MKLGIVLLAACVAGCAALGERQPHRYHVLEPQAASAAAPRNAVAVAPPTAASFYDTQDIVFSRSPGPRGYYQFNHWTERPQKALADSLAARFPSGGGRYILTTHLVEIYHDAAQAPGSVRVTITAGLVDRTDRSRMSHRTFTREVPSRSHDAAGAVASLDEATGALVDEIVDWADREVDVRGAGQARPIQTESRPFAHDLRSVRP